MPIMYLRETWRGPTRDAWDGSMYSQIFPGLVDVEYLRRTIGDRDVDTAIRLGVLIDPPSRDVDEERGLCLP